MQQLSFHIPSTVSLTRDLHTAQRLIQSTLCFVTNTINPVPSIQAMFNFIYARASRFTIVQDNSASDLDLVRVLRTCPASVTYATYRQTQPAECPPRCLEPSQVL